MHLNRLYSGIKQLQYNFKYKPSELEAVLLKTIKKNSLKKGIIRLIVSRGDLKELNFRSKSKSNLFVLVKDIPQTPAIPVKIMFLPASNFNQREGTDILKTLSYSGNIQAIKEAEKNLIFEPIFYNDHKEIKEGATKNIFFIKDNCIFTPPLSLGILDGIMRNIILDTAKKLGLNQKNNKIKIDSIFDYDEMFLSSSVDGPMPCTYKNYKSDYAICNKIKDRIVHLYETNF